MFRASSEDNMKMTSLKNLLSSSDRLTKYQLTQIFISGGFSEINEKVTIGLLRSSRQRKVFMSFLLGDRSNI